MTTPKRRVGLVIGQLGFGGAEGQLYELARSLGDVYEVRVYCLSSCTEPYGRRLAEQGVPVRSFASSGSFDLRRVVSLARALRRDRIEVVHAFLFIASAYAYLATRLLRRAVLIASARNCKREAHPVRRWVIRRAFRAADAVVCNSEAMRHYAIQEYGAPVSRCHVVYNGVDADRFVSPAPHPRPFVAGTVGRIEAQKNLSLFLEAAARVVDRRPDARFAVVGEGSLRGAFEADAASRGLGDAVRFLGTTEDVAGFLAGIEQFWLTSDWEGTPNVVLEAMAAGRPVLATDAGAVSELVIDGKTGYVLPRGDAEALAARSLELLDDAELATRMGRAGADRVRAVFSISKMAEETSRVYERAGGRAR